MVMSRSNALGECVGRIGEKNILAMVLALASIALFTWHPVDLPVAARVSLLVFLLSVIGWTLTTLNDTFVALFAAAGLVLSATISTDNLFASLGDSIVWLMIGAFIVSAALNKSGIATRVTAIVLRPARNLSQLFYMLTAVLLLTALVIPSTSARAALMVPIYTALTAVFNDARVSRALAIMLPVNILQTAIGSLVGAGAHLIINDTLGQFTGRPLTFMEWTLMGMPFAALSAFGTTWVILHVFLDRGRRTQPLSMNALASLPQTGALSVQAKYVSGVTMLLIVLWMTEPLHGVGNALVAMLGALAVTVPTLGPIKFKDAAKSVEWEMVLFVAASMALSDALVQSGAGKWLIGQFVAGSGAAGAESRIAALALVAAVTLTSHLYITSRSARGAVIAPLIILMAYTLGIDPLTLTLVTAAGIGYCITLAVSAKPLTMFQQLNAAAPTFAASDLLKLSGLLAPLHAGLLLAFGLLVWPAFAQPAHLAALAAPPTVAASSPVVASAFAAAIVRPAERAVQPVISAPAEASLGVRTAAHRNSATEPAVRSAAAVALPETRHLPAVAARRIGARPNRAAAPARITSRSPQAAPAAVQPAMPPAPAANDADDDGDDGDQDDD